MEYRLPTIGDKAELQSCLSESPENGEMFVEFLRETESIDFGNPAIQAKADELKRESASQIEYAERAFCFVRDEIPHSWDINSDVVSRKASEALINGTGICWTKSCLLAALLRANGIPSGISYQRLTRADDCTNEGYIIHALNTVYIEDLGRWIRLDARGNKENVHAQFSLDEEILAFPVRSELGEVDYRDNNPDLDDRLVRILNEYTSIQEVSADFAMHP